MLLPWSSRLWRLRPLLPEEAAQQGYRLRVKLRWKPGVWCDLEMPGDQQLSRERPSAETPCLAVRSHCLHLCRPNHRRTRPASLELVEPWNIEEGDEAVPQPERIPAGRRG